MIDSSRQLYCLSLLLVIYSLIYPLFVLPPSPVSPDFTYLLLIKFSAAKLPYFSFFDPDIENVIKQDQ